MLKYMTTHVARITRSYQDISELIANWATTAEHMLVYEHAADEEIKKTHCHILMVNCTMGQEGLKKRAKTMGFNFSGNKDWSFTDPLNDIDKYITYMTKGCLFHAFNKCYSTEFLEERKAAWVSPPSSSGPPQVARPEAADKPPGKTMDDLYDSYAQDILGDDITKFADHLTVDHFRGPSLQWWRKRTRLLPQASTYKRFLATLYLDYLDLKRKPYDQPVEDQIMKVYA